MEEQLKKHKTPGLRKSRPVIVFSGFAVLVVAIVVVTVLTANHVADNRQKTTVAVVNITKTGFEPATLSVKRGTKIIWTNTTDTLRQVASNPYPKDNGLSGLKSQILNKDQTYEYTADTTGTFGYHDDRQPTVNGTLVVQR